MKVQGYFDHGITFKGKIASTPLFKESTLWVVDGVIEITNVCGVKTAIRDKKILVPSHRIPAIKRLLFRIGRVAGIF